LLTVGFEVFATACLQASAQFTRLWPTLGVIAGYGLAFWFLSLTLQKLPLGIVYATWSGAGIVLVTAVGLVVFGQKVDLAALVGMGLVIAGLITMHLFSTSNT
jgi:small multidrug resistance pump